MPLWVPPTSEAALSATFAPLAAGIEGTGMPNGVVTAPVGTVYRDLAATNGAIVWVKASGSGSSGWRVVWGDTGWRIVTAWDSSGVVTEGTLSSGWQPRTGVAGDVRIRRTAMEVWVQVRNLQAAAATTSDPIVSLPAGFRGEGLMPGTSVGGLTVGGATVPFQVGADVYRAAGSSFSQGAVIEPSCLRAPAQTSWPTTLPGTPA